MQAEGKAGPRMHSSPRSEMGADAAVASCPTGRAMGRSNIRDDQTRESSRGAWK